jgi:hypothetical protein
VADDDMTHALRNAIRKLDVDDVALFIGPARDGSLLEVGVLGVEGDDPAVIHAMRLRPAFHRLL